MTRIGVDLGGTKIEAIALDDAGRELIRRRIASPSHDYAQIIAAVRGLVDALEGELGMRASVGVGTPGAISSGTGRIKNANSTQLNGRPLADDLALALGREIRVDNDANCFALSEASDGAAAGRRLVFGVILGTGVGGGVVVDGKVIRGANAIAGEWGHNPIPAPTADDLPHPDCYCGRKGCIETYLSGPGLSNDHERATGERLATEQVVLHEKTMRRYEERLARSLAGVINVLDPDVIVLGGGMSNVARLYTEVPRLWSRHVFSDRVATKLLPPVHGDSSGVRGAAWLWDAY